jgi:hypothetical protein
LSPLKFYQRAATACSTVALLSFAPQIHAITVVEYYNKSIDAHFLTGRAAEQAALDTVPDFQRTGMTFQAADAATAAAPLVPICRFYIAAASPYTSSHFYGRKGVDCESINAALPAGFTYEGFDFALPQPTAGACAAGSSPIYRGFRNAAGGRTANHRYTASAETFDASASAGYSKEGVAFCASAATAATSTALAVTTAFGAGSVAATSKVITAAGDSIAVNGITVKAQRNQLSGATLSVQAISDTLNGGSGASLLITSSAPWKDRLVVSFPIVAGVDSADNTRIALQNADGTWQVLATFADATAGVLRALVPTPPANLSSASDSHLKAGALVSARLAKFDPFTLKPDGASVKVGSTQAFVAYARIDEERENEQLRSPTCQAARIAQFAAIDLDDELTPLLPTACENQKVTTDQAFKNNKAGYTRSWSLIGPGQIAPSGDTQGLYTAPGTKPTPDTAQVAFESKHIATGRAVIILGRIKIVTVIQGYSGTFTMVYPDFFVATGRMRFVLDDPFIVPGLDLGVRYYSVASGEMTQTINQRAKYPDHWVEGVATTVPVVNDKWLMIVSGAQPASGKPFEYQIGANFSGKIAATCYSTQSNGTVKSTACPYDASGFYQCDVLAGDYFYTDVSRLTGSCTIPKSGFTATWDFKAD